MSALHPLLLLTCALSSNSLLPYAVTASDSAYPPPYGLDDQFSFSTTAETDSDVPVRREVYGGGRIIDITHRYHRDMPSWESADGVGEFVWLQKGMKNGSIANNSKMMLGAHTGTHVDAPGHVYDHYFDAGFDVDTLDLEVLNEGLGQFLTLLASMKNGFDYNFSEMRLPVHSGTHVDAPGHYYDNYFDEGYDVDSLDLRILNGPALLVDVPRDKNITAEVMKSLNIPKGVKRVLFRTLNTDRGLMYKKEFDTSYVGFMKDGAQWLVDNTDIKLVGIDYLSVAAFDHLIPSHLVFLKDREVILVEGLKLDNVKAGIYDVHCLHLRLLGSEGSPIRCILIK